MIADIGCDSWINLARQSQGRVGSRTNHDFACSAVVPGIACAAQKIAPTSAVPMSFSSQLSSRTWLIALLCAAGFLIWADYVRVQRVQYVTNTDREDAVVDAASPTGYAGGERWLIVPEHNNRSYQWIAETQQMLAKHEWRVRHVDYENAPTGREVHSASLYRWWLGLISWGDHIFSGRPIGLSVERAALVAEPLLHLLLLAVTTFFVACHFGSFPAMLAAIALATLYPFAGGFLPGMPDDQGLSRVCALWSLLPLLAWTGGAVSSAPSNPSEAPANENAIARPRSARLFFFAGVAGGIGLWVSAANQTPIMAGIALGGVLTAWITSRAKKTNSSEGLTIPPWRMWALGGAFASLGGYLIEYFPAHMDFRLEVNHPLYAIAWLGVGELLARFSSRTRGDKPSPENKIVRVLIVAIAITAIVTLPVAMRLLETQVLFTGDLSSSRLTNLADGAIAKSLGAWISRDGFTGAFAATCLPLLSIGLVSWLIVRRQTANNSRAALALALGPVAIALIFACFQLRWFNTLDGLLLALLVVASTINIPRSQWVWTGYAGLFFIPGAIQLVSSVKNGASGEFTRLEAESLIERGLAHWIADHAPTGETAILAPPDRTTSWCFHGGLRGLGTANWENRAGLTATVRIVTATTADQALELIHEHGITHLILPSWDSDLDEFVRWTLPNPNDSFLSALHHWALPPWLKPVPYKLPSVAGFEDRSVVILEVTEDSNRALAFSRLAEYFVETKQPGMFAPAAEALRRYPTDLGALVALAEIEKAQGDTAVFSKTFAGLLSSLSSGFDRMLVWDRRVSLAVVLAQANREDLSKEQLRHCMKTINETRIRSLTTLSLFRLLTLSKAYEINLPDPKLRELALKLLPAELRGRF